MHNPARVPHSLRAFLPHSCRPPCNVLYREEQHGQCRVSYTVFDDSGNLRASGSYYYFRNGAQYVEGSLHSLQNQVGLIFANDEPYDLVLSLKKNDNFAESFNISYNVTNSAGTVVCEYTGTVNLPEKDAVQLPLELSGITGYLNILDFPTYAKELSLPFYAHGMDGVINEQSHKIQGILNGIDVESYDPNTDPAIPFHYSQARKTNKKKDKAALEDRFGFEHEPDVPIIGLISRLVSHKGLDLITAIIDELLYNTEVRMIVLGSGDSSYENYFRGVAERHPDKFRVELGFDPGLARKIYAGADLFLMPSKSEPCGLSQMIALRYGTIPIVRETGGLKDTVQAYNWTDGSGNGFSFDQYRADLLLNAVNYAKTLYFTERDNWDAMVRRAMETDHSWNASAKDYIALYHRVLGD